MEVREAGVFFYWRGAGGGEGDPRLGPEVGDSWTLKEDPWISLQENRRDRRRWCVDSLRGTGREWEGLATDPEEGRMKEGERGGIKIWRFLIRA